MTGKRSSISLPVIRHSVAGVVDPGPPASATPATGLWRDESERRGKFAAGDAVHNEFADGASEFPDDLSRRNFLKVAGASLAVGALAAGCDYVPQTKIVPYVNPPADVVAGQPTYYATAMPMSGFGFGVLAESHEGRPTKIEGNPDHPASLGKTNVFMQASVLQLYDPERSREVTQGGLSSTWDLFLAALRDRLEARKGIGGKGVALLMGRNTSEVMRALMVELRSRFPAMTLHRHEPMDRTVAGPWLIYKLENAKVILSLDSDFLFEEPGSIHYAMKFADGRRVRHDKAEMNRLYVVEGNYSMTGSMADHRRAIRPSQVPAIAAAFARELGVKDIDAKLPPPPEGLKAWIATVAQDLRSAGKGALIVPGIFQPPAVYRLAMAMNQALGSWQNCVTYCDIDSEIERANTKSLASLVNDMKSGTTDTLLILGGNPAYDAPADLHFAEELERFSRDPAPGGGAYRNFSAHLGLYDDETSYRCQWNLPESHYLEAWGDIRGYEGTGTIIQPLILPLYPSKSAMELADIMLGRSRGGYQIERDFWLATYRTPADFEGDWHRNLRNGTLLFAMEKAGFDYGDDAGPAAPKSENADQIELIFRPDPTVYDGSFASLGWLQECPKPFTKLTWDNAALISPALAKRRGLVDGDMVRLSLRGQSLECAVIVLPGHADSCVTLSLGYGRTRAGEVGTGRGFNAYALRFSDAPWFAPGATLRPIPGKKYQFAVTRSHHAMDAVGDTFANDAGTGVLRPEEVDTPNTPDYDIEVHNRKLVRVMDLSQYKQGDPGEMIRRMGGDAEEKPPLLSLYPGWDYSKGMQWGMSIDLNSCIGCNACLVACVAENNIATVGKEQVILQREMHWIRIDDYFAGDENNPKVFHEPVPCQHCENAPCEVVCPVGATTHSTDGLNEMTYNRCVGTRYCSNNCPYKVRRFNFLLFSDETTQSIQGQRNPEVTVRSRGVMEKCTYCVQRIRRSRIEIEKMQVRLESQGRFDQVQTMQREMLASLQTACQQACPTNAIVFGDKNDPTSEVTKLKNEPLNYTLLTELTTVPRTSYLARMTNLNPDLPGGPAQ